MLGDEGSVRASAALIFFGIVAAAGVLALILMCVLSAVGGQTGQWERRSYIAQSLQTPFTILTVLVIAGGVVTLWQTAREQRAAGERATFAEHRELEKMAMDRPYLHAVWGGPADPALADDDINALTYANMIMGFWQMSYHGGVTGEAEVRLGARRFFTGRIGRAYWRDARDDRAVSARGRIERRFHEIVDAEYQAALGSSAAPDEPVRTWAPAATPPPVRPSVPASPPSTADEITGAGVGGLLASIVSRALRQRRTR